MSRDNFLIFITDLIFFGFPNGWHIYRARFKKKGEVTIRLKQHEHPIILRCATSDFNVFDQVFKSREYNLSMGIDENSFILDAGANIGLASIFFSHKYPNSKIIAIEPEESNFQILKRNTQNYPNIHCQKKAVWHEKTQLYIKNDIGDKWSFTVSKSPNIESKIEAISIPDILQEFQIKKIDILKIDIEGAELELFSYNYDSWLPKVKILLVELHDFSRPGASYAFFTTLLKHNFNIGIKGEKIIATQLDSSTDFQQ